MSRGTKAIIRQAAWRHNFQVVKNNAQQAKVWSVVKANAYGHGVSAAVQALKDVTDGFAVATLAEGIALRELGIDKPILLLEGITFAEHLADVIKYNLQTVVHCQEQLDFFHDLKANELVTIWLKLDSGLHRIGFSPENLPLVEQRLSQQPQLILNGYMTHLANADDPNHAFTDQQISVFEQAVPVHATASLANSAAIVHFPQAHKDWVRPGIMLYGATPSANRAASDFGLVPVMTLQTPIIAIRSIKKGDRVGYGQRWQAERDSLIATLAIGYGDGYPRHAPDGTPFWLRGQKIALAGRVSMDMITVDVTDIKSAKVGDMVECWGDHLPVDEVAHAVGTIGYELLTRVSTRVVFEVV